MPKCLACSFHNLNTGQQREKREMTQTASKRVRVELADTTMQPLNLLRTNPESKLSLCGSYLASCV